MAGEYSQVQRREKAEVEAILASEMFKRAPNLWQVLAYVSKLYFSGESSKIKEYNIGVEALARGADFDPNRDTIVRVEASRLRKRLKEYYSGEGADHELQLVLPRSGYVPQFVPGSAAEQEIESVESNGEEVSSEENPLRVRLAANKGLVAACGLALLMLALAASLWWWTRQTPATQPTQPAAWRTDSGMTPLDVPAEGVRILAGYMRPQFVDSLGRRWLGDCYFTGGQASESVGGDIFGVLDPTLYRTARRGDFRYDIPLKPGPYELHLLFAETSLAKGNRLYTGEAARLFHVDINGVRRLSSFDILGEAGATDTPADRHFKDITPAQDGRLHLQFTSVESVASLNGIEILPAAPGKLAPLRILAGGRSFYDRSGRLWEADRYFIGGRPLTKPTLVVGTSDPELYRNERWGHFSYSIPVAPIGHYTVILKFADTQYGPSNPGGGGVGSRIFDVYCNGVVLLRDFDVFKEAGGENRAVEKIFTGLKPNAQSHLLLSFVPVKGYASVRVIEVLDEGR